MGLFSRAVPQRKWPGIAAELGSRLKRFQDVWFGMVQKEAAARGLKMAPVLSTETRRFISVMQIGTVSATIEENRYARTPQDTMFLAECVYILVMTCPPEQMHDDIANVPFALMSGDLRVVLDVWAKSMANEIAPNAQRGEFAAMLEQYGALIVATAKIDTCESFGDSKAANRVTSELFR